MNYVLMRAIVIEGSLSKTAAHIKKHWRLYPFEEAANPQEPHFVDLSGLQYNTIHANDFSFYEELNEVIQAEPGDAFNPELVGLWASIGIKKGKPFSPDARMKGALTGHFADYGIDDNFIKRVRSEVEPGTSALFLMTTNAVVDRVVEELKGMDFELVSTNLSKEQEEELRNAFGT